MAEEHVLRVTHLRHCLGWAGQQVALTGEPIIIQRYKRQDVVMVPLWEWQLFKQLEAQIKAGHYPVGRENRNLFMFTERVDINA
jgi:hypothetical protein